MKKITAVEYLITQLHELNMKQGLSKKQYLGRRIKIENTARQMMKMQIIHAHGKKIDGGFRANGDFFFDVKTGQEYYEKNFKD
jgi:hypothetical protein